MTSKVCTKCKENKLFTEFFKDNSSKTGVSSWCKICRKQQRQEIKEKNETIQIDLTQSKVCSKCKISKPSEDFNRETRNRTGLSSYCKSCENTKKEIIDKENVINLIHQSKTCAKCKLDKISEEFNKDKSRKSGLSSWCKGCRLQQRQDIKEKNKTIQIDLTESKVCSKCRTTKLISEYYTDKSNAYGVRPDCKECWDKIKTKYRLDNKELVKEAKRRYERLEKCKARRKDYRERSGEKIKLNAKKYREENKAKLKQLQQEYNKNNRAKIRNKTRKRLQENVKFRLSHNLRARFHDALKRAKISKNSSVHDLIGCTVEDLKAYLASLFEEGMSWDNYGKWEIDHILPVASFDLTSIDQQKACFNYKNLQPLWAEENRKKGCKIIQN